MVIDEAIQFIIVIVDETILFISMIIDEDAIHICDYFFNVLISIGEDILHAYHR